MITYFGSKSRIGKWLVEYYPNDMEIYTEIFGGAYWCYFNMDLNKFPKLKTIVYNDINPLNANLFRCAKNHEEFYQELIKYPCQQFGVIDTPKEYREMFNRFQIEVFNDDLKLDDTPNFEIGAKYAYVLSQTFSSMRPATSKYIDLKGKYRSKFLSFVNKFNNSTYIEHLDKINIIECKDFEEVMKEYDSTKTFHYVDAPYFNRESQYSNHTFTTIDHKRLADCVDIIKGNCAISYYDFPELSEWYPKDIYRWKSKDFKKASGASKGKKQSTGTELLIMNY